LFQDIISIIVIGFIYKRSEKKPVSEKGRNLRSSGRLAVHAAKVSCDQPVHDLLENP